MLRFIVYLPLVVLLGVIPSLLPAQQNQSAQKLEQRIEAIEKRISELEKQLQTVENVEKLDLQAKLTETNAQLAEANSQLINAEFSKFERELRDSNFKWLTTWILLFLAVLSAVGLRIWFWLKSRTNQSIRTEVEKNLNGFKKAVEAQDAIKNQVGVLEKQYVASVLSGAINYDLLDEHQHPQPIRILREEVLLQVFDDDKTYYPILMYKAAEVLAARKSPRLVSPLLNRLILEADSDSDPHDYFNVPELTRPPRWPDAVKFLEYMHTPETYEGLKTFLNHLLTENPKSKDRFLEETVSSLVQLGIELEMGDSVTVLRRAIPYLNDPPLERESLGELASYFDIFNEPIGIKEILNQPVTGGMSDVEVTCIRLLKKHDSKYVEEWIASRRNDGQQET